MGDSRREGGHQKAADDDSDSLSVDLDHLQPEDRTSEDSLIPNEHNEVQGISSDGAAGPPRSLTFIHGLAIVIGFQIGSGIFSAPAAVRSYTSSTGIAMLAWATAGIIAATGAASFATLGKLVPLNGGIQEYLRLLYGDIFGFLFAWMWIFISRPLALAMVSLIFSDYLFKAILPEQEIPTWVFKLSAILAVAAISWLNCMGTRIGTGLGNIFLGLKIFGLGSIAIVGLWVSTFGSSASRDSTSGNFKTRRSAIDLQRNAVSPGESSEFWVSLGGFVEAVLAAAFAFGGWESLGFVGGEIKNPDKTLPQILRIAMSFTVTLFLTSAFALYMIVPPEVLKETDAPALEFGKTIFGLPGVIFYAWVVCVCCLGSLNSNVFATSRLTQAAGDRQYLPPFLEVGTKSADERNPNRVLRYFPRYFRLGKPSGKHEDTSVPRNAMLLNCLLASIYVLIGSFRGLMTFKGMMEFIVYLATVGGLLASSTGLRRRDIQPTNAETGSIFSPLVFCCLVGVIVLQSVITHLSEFALIVGYLGICSGMYFKRYWIPGDRGGTLSEGGALRQRPRHSFSEGEAATLASIRHDETLATEDH